MGAFKPWLLMALLLVASPVFAIDCGRAKSEVEKAICGDAEAKSADEELGRAFERVRGSLPANETASLKLSQRNWIQVRDTDCLAPRALKPLSKCLKEKSALRQKFLEGRPIAGEAPAGQVRPMFIYRSATNKEAGVSIEALKFTGDESWETKLNAAIGKLVKSAVKDADLSESQDAQSSPNHSYFVDLGVSLSFAAPRFVSINASYENELGQAHPFRYAINLNFEIPTGRELQFEDLLNKADAKKIFQLCRSQIVKEKLELADVHGVTEKTDDIDPKEVEELTRQFSNWRFGGSGVEINYGDDAFGGYGRCECSCSISYEELRPLAKKDFPLP